MYVHRNLTGPQCLESLIDFGIFFFLDAHSKTGWKTIPYPGTAIPSILWDISIDFGLIKLKFAALRSHEHFMAGKDQFGKIKTSFFGFLLCIDKINFFKNKLGIT